MSDDSLLGRQLANFRLERVIGRGGMATVYYGWDVKLERPVAIKLIDARHQDDAEYARRFVREAQAMAKWRHEHIVQVYYADDQDGLYYFVMEYVDGQNLAQLAASYHEKGGRTPPDRLLQIGRAVAAALDYAHEQGVIHRDVKPANVLVANDGRTLLTDFGLALDVNQGTQGNVFGSSHYIAPEQARRSAAAVPQSDLYSLGVIFYEMLVGRVPFDDPSPTVVALQHLTQTPPLPREINPALSPAVEKVLLKALNKEPAGRYQQGAELVEALAEALAGAETDSPSPAAGGHDLIGQQLDEYRLDELIGRGGMARVYRGYDVRLKRHAAIKVIDARYQNDADYTARFEREAQAIAQLDHPHIVRLYRYGEVNGLFYMAMQYIEGSDLAALLSQYHREGDPFPLEKGYQIIVQVCAALDYAHQKGVIHRDVKPSNILLDQDEQVYLTDFGLALLTDSGTHGQVLGSPLYIAPEQAISSARAIDQSDLYSVGVILYEMAAGQVPFDAGDPLTTAMRHATEPPTPPRQIRPDISPGLENLILRALAKEPDKRFADGGALAAALQKELFAGESEPAIDEAGEENAGHATARKSALPPLPAALSRSSLRENGKPATETANASGRRRRFLWPLMLLLAIFIGAGLYASPFDVEDLLAVAGAVSPGQPSPTATAAPAATNTATTAPSPTADAPLVAAAGETSTPTTAPTGTPSPTATPTTASTPMPTTTPTMTPTPTPAAPTATATPLPPTATATPYVRPADGMPIIFIPAGSFIMGAADNDPEAEEDERPAGLVRLSSFYIDQYPVTVAQYAAYINELGGYVQRCFGYTCLYTRFETMDSYLTATLSDYIPMAGYDRYPINNVSWYGAAAYCQAMGGRLPTEAEWEYAARGPDNRLYPWGNEFPDATLAVFEQRSVALLAPVDALPAGASYFNVYSMAGGLWEWVSDWYDPAYYQERPSLNPVGPERSGVSPPARVLRGGAWNSPAAELRASKRGMASPLAFQREIGFRCVYDELEPADEADE